MSDWLPDEDASVDWHWGEEPLTVTAGRVGRTVEQVRHRLRARGMSTAAWRGKSTIAALAERTGYTWAQVARAVRGAKLRPVRTGTRLRAKRTLLSEKQCRRVIEYLGEETAIDARRCRVHDVAQAAGVGRSTAWQYAKRMQLQTQRGVLADDDALALYAALHVASRPDPPGHSKLTVKAVANASGYGRKWAYRVAARKPRLKPARDGQLTPEDADELRRRLGRRSGTV